MASDRYVSRGGEKLEAALKAFGINPRGKVVLDVGSSTGGFVDCLLVFGAEKVYSVDTAYGELAWTLRKNPKVVVMERTNILHLDNLPKMVDLITIDASWTRLELVLPKVREFLKDKGAIIALLKPQYQAEKKSLKKGIVKEDQLEDIKKKTLDHITNLGFKVIKEVKSPILGGRGNSEYLILITC